MPIHAGQYLRCGSETQHIVIFKVGKHWISKYFFDDKDTFRKLADYYNRDHYRFESKTIGERNKVLKLLELNGFNIDLVEDLKGYMVKMNRYSKYAPVLKNSVAHIETLDKPNFLMKDLAAVEGPPEDGS